MKAPRRHRHARAENEEPAGLLARRPRAAFLEEVDNPDPRAAGDFFEALVGRVAGDDRDLHLGPLKAEERGAVINVEGHS